MSWDVMVLNYKGSPPDDPEDESIEAEPLGSSEAVRQAISKYLPEVDWSEPDWGIYEDEAFSLEFNMGDDDPIEDIMVHVRGGGDPISALLKFATPNKWSILDFSMGEFLDPENPSNDGWKSFQIYRDQVLANPQDEDDKL